MKNNCIVFACGLMMLSAQSFASASAPIENEPGQQEGQPHIVPGGAPIFSSASVGSSVKMYKDQATQTEISAKDDEQKILRVRNIFKNADKMTVMATEKALSDITQKAQSGSVIHACAIQKFKSLIVSYDGLPTDDEVCEVLKSAGLMERSNASSDYYVKDVIADAYYKLGLMQDFSDSE